jgi:iron complex transport system ATP-binding protein
MSKLELRGASVARGQREILHDASIALTPGEFVALVGPNGSGKTTLLRALAGLWPASPRAAALLDERAIHELPRREVARRIAYVSQDSSILFAFTVEEIVRMGRYPHRGRFTPESAADRDAVEHAIAVCDIAHLATRAANTLSGGERQRVLIARSLAVEPEFILLDEPTANLDVEHSFEVLDLCRGLASSGHAIALATHDLNAALRYASKAVLIYEGRIALSGSCAEVLSPQSLERVFHVRADALTTPAGDPFFVFHRRI